MQGFQQTLKFFAVQGAACGHDSNAPGFALCSGGFERGLYADDRQLWVPAAQVFDGRSSCGIAGHHQNFDAVLPDQIVRDGVGPRDHMAVVALSIGCVAAVGHVNETLQRQFGNQCL